MGNIFVNLSVQSKNKDATYKKGKGIFKRTNLGQKSAFRAFILIFH